MTTGTAPRVLTARLGCQNHHTQHNAPEHRHREGRRRGDGELLPALHVIANAPTVSPQPRTRHLHARAEHETADTQPAEERRDGAREGEARDAAREGGETELRRQPCRGRRLASTRLAASPRNASWTRRGAAGRCPQATATATAAIQHKRAHTPHTHISDRFAFPDLAGESV